MGNRGQDAAASRNLRNPVPAVKEPMVLKSVRLIVEFAIGAAIGIALLTGLVAWRVAGQPVSLSFLTPYLEQALSAEDGKFTTHLDDTLLTWAGWEHGLDIRLRGVRAVGSQGEVLAAVPEMSVSLSLRGLLHGVVAPTGLEIFRPKMRVVRGADGQLQLGFEEAGPEAGNIMARLVTDLLSPPNLGRAMGYLTTIEITDADLTLVDEKVGTTWHAPVADLMIGRDKRGITGIATLKLDLEGDHAEIDADVGYDRDARLINLGATFSNISLARIAAKQNLIGGLESFAVPLNGTLTATLDLDGKVEVLGFDITGGPGKLSLPKLYPEALPVTKFALRGRLEENLTRYVIDRLHADLGGPSVDFTGRMFRTAAELTAQGEVTVNDMPSDSLMRYWPASLAEHARTWIAAHISHGSVPETRAVIAAQAPKGDLNKLRLVSIAGDFKAKGLRVAYLPPMEPVENVSGQATFTARELDITVTGGEVHGVRVTGGKVTITGLDVEDQDADIDMALQGPLSGIVTVLDSEPIGAASFLGIAPQDIGGDAGVRAHFKLPLEQNLSLARVELGAAANVTGASIKHAALHQDLDRGQLSIKVDKEGIKADGTAYLGGVPASITVAENFSDAAPVKSRFTASAKPDDSDLARFGYPVAPYITGPVPLSLAYVVGHDGKGDLSLTADLGPAAMAVSEINWSKPAKTPGTGRFTLALGNDRPVNLREFALAAGTLTANGSGTFGTEGAGLERVDFTRLAFGRTDVAGHIKFREGGGFDLDLRGPQIDAADYFSLKANKKAKEEKPYAISANTDVLWLGPDNRVVNASLRLDQADDRWRSLDFQGGMETTKDAKEIPSFRMTISPDGDTRKVTVATGDAGTFLRNFGIFDNMLGGTLTLSGAIDDKLPARPFKGRLHVKDYRVVRVPALAKILTVASLTGILNVMSGEGIGFSDLKADLALAGDTLTVTAGRAYGRDLGLTMKGTINITNYAADCNGTIVPAYALNSVLGNIPIVGDILTGGKGSGVFAATYRLTGSIQDPTVELNPLAALTPGVLRNIFGIFDSSSAPANGDKTAAPDDNSPDADVPNVQEPNWKNQ